MPFETGTEAQRQQAMADKPLQAQIALNGLYGGAILLSVCIVAVARLVATRRPTLAAWGGALALAGTYVSALFGGVMMFEIALAQESNRDVAMAVLLRGEPPIVAFLVLPGMILGWLILALGAWRSGALNRVQALGLAGPALLPFSVMVAPILLPFPYLILAAAIVPLGVQLLLGKPTGNGPRLQTTDDSARAPRSSATQPSSPRQQVGR